MKISEEVRSIAHNLFYYYLDKENGPDTICMDAEYMKANRAIRELGISNITYDKGIITITLSRPGIFIGAKGSNIDSFSAYLKTKMSFTEIKIIEDRLPDYLYLYCSWLDDDDWEEV